MPSVLFEGGQAGRCCTIWRTSTAGRDRGSGYLQTGSDRGAESSPLRAGQHPVRQCWNNQPRSDGNHRRGVNRAISLTEFCMSSSEPPVSIVTLEAAPRTKPSNYPEPFASRMAGREKRPLGDVFGLSNFGVNLTRLPPGACSALRHAHTKQDEFVYVLTGHPLLITDHGETPLHPGMCAGFKAGTEDGHHMVNSTNEEVLYLEVGDRTPGDSVSYPDDDLKAVLDSNGKWQFVHKDGTPY